MRDQRRMLAVVLLVGSTMTPSVMGQTIPARPAEVLEVPFFDRLPATYGVTAVDPQGTARIELLPAFQQFKPPLLEGYYVLAVRAGARPGFGQPGPEPKKSARPEPAGLTSGETRLFRTRVVEVDTPTSAKLELSREAIGQLRKGENVLLLRPAGSTTAQLKGLPGMIPVGSQKAGSTGSNELQQAMFRAQSVGNLRAIGLAFHNYHATFNAFPPAVIYGPDGKPWHSWRVLILPYIEEATLYNQYDFREPWDSPKNRKLLEKLPRAYRDPVYGDDPGHFTHYAALVGTWTVDKRGFNTALPPAGIKQGPNQPGKPAGFNFSDPAAPSIRNVVDGTSNTVVVVPVSPERKIPWTKPEDISVDANFPGIGKPGGMAAPYRAGDQPNAPRLAPVLFLDGSVRMLPDSIDLRTLRALTTRDGLEAVDLAKIPPVPAMGMGGQAARLRIHLDGAKTRATIE